MLGSSEEAVGKGHMALPDLCVCCGEPVPEGWQVCWGCQRQYEGVAPGAAWPGRAGMGRGLPEKRRGKGREGT